MLSINLLRQPSPGRPIPPDCIAAASSWLRLPATTLRGPKAFRVPAALRHIDHVFVGQGRRALSAERARTSPAMQWDRNRRLRDDRLSSGGSCLFGVRSATTGPCRRAGRRGRTPRRESIKAVVAAAGCRRESGEAEDVARIRRHVPVGIVFDGQGGQEAVGEVDVTDAAYGDSRRSCAQPSEPNEVLVAGEAPRLVEVGAGEFAWCAAHRLRREKVERGGQVEIPAHRSVCLAWRYEFAAAGQSWRCAARRPLSSATPTDAHCCPGSSEHRERCQPFIDVVGDFGRKDEGAERNIPCSSR